MEHLVNSSASAPPPNAALVWAIRVTTEVLDAGHKQVVHDHMALAYLTRGWAVVHQGERFDLRTGDVYLVPAGEPHGIVAAHEPEAWGIGFSPACYAPTELEHLLVPFHRVAAGASKVVRIPAERQEHLAHLCAELHRETRTAASRPHAELVQKSLLALILAEVARVGPCAAPHVGIVSDALRFIERHCLGPVSLGDVAASVHRSPAHVSTLVRRATGKSVKQWIITGRMAEARRRLLHTDEMVDVIAERVGYADPTHFIRLFRRAHGSTPAAWRTQHRTVAPRP